MKLLQINAVNVVASTGRTTMEINDYLNDNGHEGIVAYSEGPKTIGSYRIGNILEKKIHAILSRIVGMQGYFSKRGTKRLIKYIIKEKPDVIRLGNLHSNFINIPMLLKFIAREDIPTIITLHDCFFFTGKCCHYTVDKCYKWKTGCNSCKRIKKDNPSLLLDRTNKMWHDKKNLYLKIPRLAVVGVSKWITSEAKQSILSSAKYIQTIYNWIDTDIFKPIDTKLKRKELLIENKFVILGVATKWNTSKGIEHFINLSQKLNHDEVILLVGDIPKDINIPSNIIHIHQTDSVNELVNYYSMADVFLQLSLEETFGKVVAESLSCGTPVIVFNSTANPELVGNRCGYVTEINSIEDVIQKIQIIKSNHKNYYSSSCRDFALDNFNKDDRIKDYIKLSQKLIGNKGEI